MPPVYPTRWRAAAAETREAPRPSSGASVQGVAGLSETPNFDALMAESARQQAAQAGVSGTRQPDVAALRRLRDAQGGPDVARKIQQGKSVDAEFAQRRDLERNRAEHGIQRGGMRHHSFVPQSMMPLTKGALAGVRFPMRHPAFQALKMALDILEFNSSRDLEAMFGPFMGYTVTNTCSPELAVPPYLGNELMADLTSGGACLLLQAIAENPLPALPASAPTVGFSTYRQGPFGRWATVTTYDPVVAGDAPALAAGPMPVSILGHSNVHNMLDALSAAGGYPAERPLPLALNAALSGHNPMRAPGEQNERGYGRAPRTQTMTERARLRYDRYGPANKKGRSRWHKSGKVGVVKAPAFPRPYTPELKALRIKRALLALIGQVTELLDHVDALYKALPESVRKKIAARFAVNKKPVSVNAKIWALLINWQQIDGGQAVYNLLYNAVFDRLQAQASKAGVKLAAEHGARPQQQQPSRAVEADSELPHGSVSGAVQAILREIDFKAPSTADYMEALGWASAQRKAVSFKARE